MRCNRNVRNNDRNFKRLYAFPAMKFSLLFEGLNAFEFGGSSANSAARAHCALLKSF